MDTMGERFYEKKCKPLQTIIAGLLQKETEILAASRSDPSTAAEKLFSLANEMLNLVSYYLILNGLSVAMLKNNNETALSEARKTLYKAVIYLENIVSGKVDAPYSDYEDKTKELILAVDEARRFEMVKKMGLTIGLLTAAYGTNSKWRWAFVELGGRFAAVTKNMLDLSNLVTNTAPDAPAYEVTMRHLAFTKQLLADTAAQYRARYNLSTHSLDDLQIARNFLSALRYLHVALGDSSEAEALKSQIDSLQAKIEQEQHPAAIPPI